MMRGETGPDFIEALARGLDVIRAFEPNRPTMALSEVAAASGLARPTARRMLLTLEELGYVRVTQGGFALTPRVLELGMAYRVDQHLGNRAPAHGATGKLYRRIFLARAARRLRYRVRCARSCAQDHHPGSNHRHALSGPSDLAWKSAPCRA